MKHFGDRLRMIREQYKMTQQDFAYLLKTTSQTIYNWEQNKNKPSIDMAVKISDLTRVSLDWLLTGKEHPYDKEYSLNVNDLTTEDMELITRLKKLPLTKHLVVKYVTGAEHTRDAIEELKKYTQSATGGVSHPGNALGPAGV